MLLTAIWTLQAAEMSSRSLVVGRQPRVRHKRYRQNTVGQGRQSRVRQNRVRQNRVIHSKASTCQLLMQLPSRAPQTVPTCPSTLQEDGPCCVAVRSAAVSLSGVQAFEAGAWHLQVTLLPCAAGSQNNTNCQDAHVDVQTSCTSHTESVP